MMEKFISMFAALVLSAVMVSVAVATPGDKGYYYGAKNPEHLAQLIDESFAKDANGKTKLSAEKCHKDGSCATPQYYFEAINKALAEAGFKKRLSNVSEVPGYIRTLKVLHSPYGKYEVSCLRPLGNDKFSVVMDCLEREFEPDEEAWVDSEIQGEYKIDLVIITSKCANVVYRKIALKITIIGGTLACVEIPFTTRPGDVTPRFALTAPAGTTISKDNDDGCLALKRAGSTVYERWWTDECANVHCDFSAPAAVLNANVLVVGSFEPKVHGTHILRLPAYVAEKGSLYVTLLCLDRVKMDWPEMQRAGYTAAQRDEYIAKRDEWITGHSDTIGVRWHDYRMTERGVMEARVHHSQAEVPPGLTPSQSNLYWHFGDWARMQQQQVR